MKRIIDIINHISKDKLLHFTICFIITLVVFAVPYAFGVGAISVVPAFFVGLGIGALKEWYDKKHGGQFNPYDLAADFIGVWLAVAIISLILAH